MLAKVIKTKRDGLTAKAIFKQRVNYCCAKASKVVIVNLAGDWRDAAAQMAFTAGLNPALRDPSAHIVLSWGDGENPPDAEIIAAARMAVQDLGAERHQHVIAIHPDRLNVHAHVVLNLVHPISGKALSLRHDYARLEVACRRIERRFGWPPDRGRFDQTIVDGGVRLVPKPQTHWDVKRAARVAGLRPDPRGVRGAARRSGRRPLRDRMAKEMRRAARISMESATGWLDLHAGLLRLGLHYFRHGSGARIIDASTADYLPASHLGSAFAFNRVVRRLGRFVPGSLQPKAAPMRGASTREDYDRDRQARREAVAELMTEHRDARRRIGHAVQGFPRLLQSAFREAVRQKQREDLLRLRRATPLPVLRDYAVDRTDRLIDPTQQWVSRYPDGMRRPKARRDGLTLPEPPLDHTRLRQVWHQGVRDDAGRRRVPSAEDLSSQFRSLGNGAAMIPRLGPRDDIVGYDLVREHPAHGFVDIGPSSRLGLGRIGDADAASCIIVSDAALGLRISLQRPDDLVIIASPTPTKRQLAQLASLIGEREAKVVEASSARSEFGERLRARLPFIKTDDLSRQASRPYAAPPSVEDEEPDGLEGPSPLA